MSTSNGSALSPRDLPPLQLKVILPLQQVELDQMQTDERSQHIEELSVDKATLRPRARAPSPWHSTLVPRHESNTRAFGLRHYIFNRICPLKLVHQAISPGSSALRSRNAPNPRKGVSRAGPSNGDPSIRHCTGISLLALTPRRSVLRSLQRVSSLQASSFRAGNTGYSGGMSEASVAPAATVDHFNPRTDLAPVIIVVAPSTASNVSSVAFAASAGANDNGSGWSDFEKPLDMLLEEEFEMSKEKKNDSMDEGAQEHEHIEMEIDNEKTVESENSSSSEDSQEDDNCWKCGSDQNSS